MTQITHNIKRALSKVKRFLLPPKAQHALWRLCVRYPRLADLYYCVNGAFRREHRAVLKGKLLHLEDMHRADDTGAEYTLRRNTHRLEKGLIMRPRRPVFAADYIGETVDVYAGLAKASDPDINPLMCWASDVLAEYFSVVAEDPRIEPHRATFQSIAPPQRSCGQTGSAETFVPYARETAPLKIDYEAMHQLAYRRRSVRWYQDKPVPRESIDRAIEVAKLSPSACNRQPFSFRIFDDPEKAREIGAIPMGTVGFSQNFPCLIVIVGDLRAYYSERDRHVIYIDAGLAAMALQFALEVQGISSCCINFPDIEPRERMMAGALGLTVNQRPIMCMSLGYPDPTGQVPYSQKKSLDEIRSYNELN